MLSGAGGGTPTYNSNAQADGAASYWGGMGAPGAGGGSEAGDAIGIQRGQNKVAQGIVMIEWS